MRKRLWAAALAAVAVFCISDLRAQGLTPEQMKAATASTNEQSIIQNREATKNWPSYGLDFQETRHSKLKSINAENVGKLGLSWSTSLESRRGVEATPIVINGVMYVTASWSVVHALDARTGKELWRYDPQVPKDYGYKGCCDVVNRGVAVHEGKVYVGAYDGFLHAIDAATGKMLWKVDTIENRAMSYTITGAPRVYKNAVLIGNGGAEFGVRGYITAYNVADGKQKWRWYSVPGDPSKPFEDKSMEAAAKTWDPAGKWWLAGGGGTMWDSMAYDPELDIMYVGTGNGSPWNRDLRSPAGGDNLYLGSVVALKPETGEYVCHHQQTPGDNWDYTSTQHVLLADLTINGQPRKVWLHAPKNGFFYVIDRTNCQFISATPFVETTWAKEYDEKGRPIENPGARAKDKPWETIPSAYGAHNWHPMSFNPDTGLVYLPAQGIPLVQQPVQQWQYNEHRPGSAMSNLGWNLGFLFNTVDPTMKPYGHLSAWDPVAKKEVWRANYVSPWNGGTLTTAGNLVFQGTADGRFIAYNAKTGEPLWQTPVGSGVVAAPSTWELDGEQYVSVAVGWGGVYGQMQRATETAGPGRVYTFKLDGKGTMPPLVQRAPAELVKGVAYKPEDVAPGLGLYVSNCLFCHGVPGVNNGGNIPNLGFTKAEVLKNSPELLLNGAFVEGGMPTFKGKLTEAQVTQIVAFIQGTADAVRPK
ncbi:quinohemoprotein ethanol dehydrogenase type-1 precursor [Variibacter gotjawalensis]|uniref:Quinohemoprotein ethanol dehydrogenase type-1 n=1 Tax=Variibacter gotjawalensis TaxID=1333996 RepID=A0A0S3Q0T8_9BRAD|nr:PQQ-dependent dehydrogenase, methanol/ethanol family [Variibacter gotjawalensis]NIK47617.1 quinohemoprotein ethanol dehydrogenase [Variibacter gotjawalensis]RZS49514.1 quinohemoprotein ethanol dehydrogenase [Variibacter gotjawalensis]BAT61777.1 quinohemoprotein ethanol dehydrogenase type-1 precursor [Variibacter gotjawalensis]